MGYKWALLSCVALAGPAFAADELAFGPPPGWVTVQPVPDRAAGSAEGPVDFLLSDAQVKLEPESATSYAHYAIRFNNAQGLAAGNVIAGWNPAFDTVTIHKVVLRRAGQQIDVLGKGQKFTILRREQNLEQQTLNGQLTATLQPEGLQVGDTLEVEMSIVHRDPTLRGHMELKSGLGSPFRIEMATLRLLTPANATVRQRLGGGMTAPNISRDGKQKISSWSLSAVVPERTPNFAPQRFTRGKTLDITDFQSWNDLAALFVPLFEQASKVAPSSPLQAEIARIKAETQDPVKRAELALQLAEQKIRYVNLALGTGGLVPADADLTWQRRFGDCKAKTALLVGLLRELGIEAAPVLVHSEEGDGLNERLPMIALFDHVVVRANVAGKTYWLDATRSGDTTLAALDVPFYHWGLPIVRNADLVKIMPGPRTRPDIEKIIHTDASAGTAKPVPTTIELVLRGDVAIAQDMAVSGLEPSLRDQALRTQLKSELDLFEIDKVSATYDTAAQVYRLRGEGRQTLDLHEGFYWTEVPSLGYKADFRRESVRDPDAPVQIGYPSYTRNVQTIVIPRELASRAKRTFEPILTTVAGVEYRRDVKTVDGAMTIETSRRALVPEISYAEAVAAQPRLRQLNDDDIGIRLSNSTPVAVAEVKDLIGHDPKSSGDYFSAAIKLLKKDDGTKAMGALDKALELSPSNGSARELRAQLKLAAGDLEAAKADAQAAIKADARNSNMYRVLAEIYRRSDDHAGALAQAAALSKIDTASSQISSGQIYASMGKTAEALAAYNRALGFEKDPMTYAHRASALPASDKAGRKAELQVALKLGPTDPHALHALSQLAGQLGEHDQALQLLDQAFLRSPDNVHIRHARAVALHLANKVDAAKREFDALADKDLSAEELNNLCWTKALANVALDRALEECNRALAKDESFAFHDSKAVVYLRQSRLDEAIAEFDLALKNGEVAASLYGRAIAYARKGDRARSDADAAQALKIAPGIERTYGHYGFTR